MPADHDCHMDRWMRLQPSCCQLTRLNDECVLAMQQCTVPCCAVLRPGVLKMVTLRGLPFSSTKYCCTNASTISRAFSGGFRLRPPSEAHGADGPAVACTYGSGSHHHPHQSILHVHLQTYNADEQHIRVEKNVKLSGNNGKMVATDTHT